jgi:hypothetical protein
MMINLLRLKVVRVIVFDIRWLTFAIILIVETAKTVTGFTYLQFRSKYHSTGTLFC